MTGFAVHAVVYLSINSLLVVLWILGGGDAAEVDTYLRDVAAARDAGFWPISPTVFWGVGLAIHGGIVVVTLPGSIRRKRAKNRKRAERTERKALRHDAASPTTVDNRKGAPNERPWVVVLFTDMADSTGLADRLGDEDWARLVALQRTVVRGCLDDHDGEEVGTQGDGCLARFDAPPEAVRAAIDIQRELAVARRGEPDLPDVRIGIHAGQVVHDLDDDDLLGRVVNEAARVTSEAAPGEILATEPVVDHVDGAVVLEDKGLRELKGVARPRHLLAVRWN